MKFIFFGPPDFAAIILEKLIKADFAPSAVVCNPDRPVGRKKIITAPPVKSLILKYGTWNIKILQPDKLDRDFVLQVSSFKPDVFIVAAYAKIIPREILDIPRLGSIGVHPSLLPKYRGSSPIQTAILNGEKETGITLFLMDERVDHGPIISKEKLEMKNEDYVRLLKKLAEMGGDLLIQFLRKYENVRKYEKIEGVLQDESLVTYTKKFKTEDGYIEPDDLKTAQEEGGQVAIEIERKIRALNPEPGAWTIKDGKRTKFLKSEITNGKLKITEVQIEGKKPQLI